MDRQIVFVDVDDVVADLVPYWISLYNDDYEDDLLVDEITDWDLTKFVKTECGKKIYNYLDSPMLYDSVKPVDGAKEGVVALRTLGVRVVYATMVSVINACQLTGKYEWLVRHGFLDEDRHEDLVGIGDKGLLHGLVLIDDRVKNLSGFQGVGVLMNRPWNRKDNYSRRADSWPDVVESVRYLFG